MKRKDKRSSPSSGYLLMNRIIKCCSISSSQQWCDRVERNDRPLCYAEKLLLIFVTQTWEENNIFIISFLHAVKSRFLNSTWFFVEKKSSNISFIRGPFFRPKLAREQDWAFAQIGSHAAFGFACAQKGTTMRINSFYQ